MTESEDHQIKLLYCLFLHFNQNVRVCLAGLLIFLGIRANQGNEPEVLWDS